MKGSGGVRYSATSFMLPKLNSAMTGMQALHLSKPGAGLSQSNVFQILLPKDTYDG
jgi:hypothetical protein